MTPQLHYISGRDGLKLVVREWRGGSHRRPLLCLPGLARTGGDFAALAGAVGDGRRVVAVDYAGHGQSGRKRDVTRYAPAACVRDVLDICAALHLHGAIGIGTSMGGLLCMGIAAARPSILRAAVLNDIGPEVDTAGLDFVRRFVATDPALPGLAACATYLRGLLPTLSLDGETDWQEMARLTYGPGEDGLWRPLWDTRMARLLHAHPPNLWPLFSGMTHARLLLVWGEASNILGEGTVQRMQAERPDMGVIRVPGIGHAPTLAEPQVVDGLRGFLERVG